MVNDVRLSDLRSGKTNGGHRSCTNKPITIERIENALGGGRLVENLHQDDHRQWIVDIQCDICGDMNRNVFAAFVAQGRGLGRHVACADRLGQGWESARRFARDVEWSNSPCEVYVVEGHDLSGRQFVKVGIGNSKRIAEHRSAGLELVDATTTTRAKAWLVEQDTLTSLAQWSYRPDMPTRWNGHTECLTGLNSVFVAGVAFGHEALTWDDDELHAALLERAA